jgi:DNA-binding NtrC family response regulator
MDAILCIKQYQWPGNVRELRHQISRAMLLSNEGHITAADLALPRMQVEQQQSTVLDQPIMPSHSNNQLTLNEAERNIILSALAEADNNVSRAARKLGITRMTMRYRMDKHKISV